MSSPQNVSATKAARCQPENFTPSHFLKILRQGERTCRSSRSSINPTATVIQCQPVESQKKKKCVSGLWRNIVPLYPLNFNAHYRIHPKLDKGMKTITERSEVKDVMKSKNKI
jgi:hypothetical protein